MSSDRPLRVLFPFVGSGVGGATVSTAEMVRRLLADGRVTPLVSVPRPGPSTALFQSAGVSPSYHDAEFGHATTLPGSTTSWSGKVRAVPTYLVLWRHARSLLRRLEVDVLHVNEDRTLLPWGAAARQLGVPAVWHIRQERPSRLLDPVRLRVTDHLVFVADANRSRFASGRRLPPSTTIHNVVDLDRFVPCADRQQAKRSLGLEPDRLTLIFVGSLVERKRPDWVLRAALELQREHRLQVLLVGPARGSDAYLRELARLVSGAPEPEHVHRLGERDDVPALLRASDLLTLPSVRHGEAFPRVVIEAMACGVPVVATDVAGVKEAITTEQDGLLIDPDDFPAYVLALDRLLSDPSLRERMGSQGVAAARVRFAGEAMATRLLQIYEEVLRSRRQRGET